MVSGEAPTSKILRPLVKTSSTTRGRRSSAGSRCAASTGNAARPAAGPAGTARRAARRRHLADHPVVEADERQVVLGDGEVLVVARIRDDRLALGLDGRAQPAREVEAVTCGVAVDPRRTPDLEAHVVAVELPGHRVRAGPTPYTESRSSVGERPCSSSTGEMVSPSITRRAVEGQVVVDELAEVGVSGGDRPVDVRPACHGARDLHPDVAVQPLADGSHPREAEGGRGRGGVRAGGGSAGAPTGRAAGRVRQRGSLPRSRRPRDRGGAAFRSTWRPPREVAGS